MADFLASIGMIAAVLMAGSPPAAAAVGWLPMPQQESQPSREAIIAAAADIMARAENCAPQARMMNPFPAEDDLVVWMATNRETRKVAEMRADPRVTLIYYDPTDPGYATLIGTVRLVDDAVEKRARWKDEWEQYYPGGPEGETYLLLEFTPDRLEVVSVRHDVAADPLAWKAAVIEFERR